ncbi:MULTISPECIES: YadA-like family protein [unclassified Zymobacter]|uniref:YadA-like family protein n=1 Tax=unclassified Zymobacter TaxID=3048685 RepID=UPI0039C157AD
MTDLPLLAVAEDTDISTRLDQHETRISTIEQGMNSLKEEQKAESDKIVWIDGSTNRAHDRINGLDNKTDTTNNTILKLSATQDAQGTTLSSHDSQISNNAQGLVDANIRIDNLKTELETKASNDALSNINGSISNVTQQVTALTGSVTQIEDRTTAIETHTASLEDQTSAVQAQAAQTEARTGQLESRTTAIETRTASLEDQTSAVQAQAAQTETRTGQLESRTTAVETRTASLEDQTSAVQAQVAQTETRTGQLESRTTAVETRTTSLEDQASAVQAQAAQTEARTGQLEGRATTLEARTTATENQTNSLVQTQATTRRQVETNRQDILRIGNTVDKAITLNGDTYQSKATERQRIDGLNDSINRVDQASIERTHRAIDRSRQYTDQKVAELRSEISDVRNEERAGIASITALSAVPTLAGKTFDVGVGMGNFKNSTAVAIGMHYQPSSNNVFSLGVATSNSTAPVVGAGFSYGW